MESRASPPVIPMRESVKPGSITFVVNDRLTLAITACRVDQCGEIPTHRPPVIEINTEQMEKVTKELQKPTNFATMFEAKVHREVLEAEAEKEAAE